MRGLRHGDHRRERASRTGGLRAALVGAKRIVNGNDVSGAAEVFVPVALARTRFEYTALTSIPRAFRKPPARACLPVYSGRKRASVGKQLHSARDGARPNPLTRDPLSWQRDILRVVGRLDGCQDPALQISVEVRPPAFRAVEEPRLGDPAVSPDVSAVRLLARVPSSQGSTCSPRPALCLCHGARLQAPAGNEHQHAPHRALESVPKM